MLIRRYRYAEERMTRILAGWIALTPELPAKLLMGRQVWDCAQHADLWGRRLPELRAPAQVSEPPSEAFVRFMDALESREGWGETLERLAGIYRVLKPHLVETYARHLTQANPVYEPPTRRILERCLVEERQHVADGERALDALADTEARRARAAAWQAELTGLLAASGGVAGEGGVSELEGAVEAHARRVVAGAAGVLADLAPGAAIDPPDLFERLRAARPHGFELVAHARIGAQHIVKTKYLGPRTLVVQERWVRDADGRWRVHEAELARVALENGA